MYIGVEYYWIRWGGCDGEDGRDVEEEVEWEEDEEEELTIDW